MSTYKVEHTNGTSTVEGVHIIGYADHLLFFDTDEKVFAGFASGTWHSFAKVELLPGTVLSGADLDSASPGFEVWDGADDQWRKGSNGLWTCYWDGVPGLAGTHSNWTSERLADYDVKVPGYKNPYAVGTVLTKEQFKAAPVGTKVSTPGGSCSCAGRTVRPWCRTRMGGTVPTCTGTTPTSTCSPRPTRTRSRW